jgi:hypothetical protein
MIFYLKKRIEFAKINLAVGLSTLLALVYLKNFVSMSLKEPNLRRNLSVILSEISPYAFFSIGIDILDLTSLDFKKPISEPTTHFINGKIFFCS